jgi:hypothetical protein
MARKKGEWINTITGTPLSIKKVKKQSVSQRALEVIKMFKSEAVRLNDLEMAAEWRRIEKFLVLNKGEETGTFLTLSDDLSKFPSDIIK